jgi:hypothetical protein
LAIGRDLAGHQVESVPLIGWAGIENVELLAKAVDARFEVLVTMDPPSLRFAWRGQQHGAPAKHSEVPDSSGRITRAVESTG